MNSVKKIPLNFLTFMSAKIFMHLPHIAPCHEMISCPIQDDTSYIFIKLKLVQGLIQ